MYAGKVELCGVDTARLPVLSEAEKSRLIKAARAGDRQARQEMVQGNLRLVLSVVQRFAGRGENMDDLFQVGCIGLIKAIDNFDPAQNVRFSTYGVPMIVGEVKRYLRDNNAVRVSRSIRDLAYHSMQAREELQKQNGREPKLSEIAARVGQSPENVAMALESAVTPTSLYEPVYSDGEDSFALLDQLRDATGEESWISDMMFRDTVRALTPRERRIIALRYLQDPDAGGKGDRHQPGPGQPPGKGRAQPYQGADLRELSFNYQKCFVGANIVRPLKPCGSTDLPGRWRASTPTT